LLLFGWALVGPPTWPSPSVLVVEGVPSESEAMMVLFDVFIQKPSSKEWDNGMIFRLHWQEITNCFESSKSVSQQRGANRKGEENTSPGTKEVHS